MTYDSHSASSVLFDRAGNPLDLVLYKFDTCGYCQRVMRRARDLRIPLRYRDTIRDPEARQTLLRIGGKTQVPCLFINGKPMYESQDIIRYLETEVRVAEVMAS